MKYWIAAAALAMAGTGVSAEMVVKEASGSVTEAMDRLEAAVGKAGATVFARVDHGAGAMKAEMELGDAQLLIFGNPKLGTPIMQQDIRAGLSLPLHVLIYDDGGTTRITYESPAAMFEGLNVDPEAEVLGRVSDALGKLTDAAAGN